MQNMNEMSTHISPPLHVKAELQVGASCAQLGPVLQRRNLSTEQLRVLEYFLSSHFPRPAELRTFEAGCAASTVVFSRFATQHTVFCLDDRGQVGSSVDEVSNDAGFNADVVRFIFGTAPSQLVFEVNESRFDIAMIGGAGSAVAPEAEYLAVSGRLVRGSILILCGIQQPRMQLLFEKLSEGGSFALNQICEDAAFFWCAGTPGPGSTKANLTVHQSRILESFLTRQFAPGTQLNTLETGCGASTILFSGHAARHTVFCDDDRGYPHSEIDAVMGAPDFKSSAVTFVYGATPNNLFLREGDDPLDIVLIGGARRHPIPEVEYLAISGRLRRGSILVLRDIHIPTVQSLFRILREDDDLLLSQTVENMAFFWCVATPGGGIGKQSWWSQRFNLQGFPAVNELAYSVDRSLPIRLDFDGWLRELPDYLSRGFSLVNGRPVTNGSVSIITFKLNAAAFGDFEIVIDVASSGREADWVCLEVDGARSAAQSVGREGVHTLRHTAALTGVSTLEIKLHRPALRPQDVFGASEEDRVQGARSELALRSIGIWSVAEQNEAERQSASKAVAPNAGVSQVDGAVVSFDACGARLHFFVHDRHDSIQANHAIGKLYEQEELDLLVKHIEPGSRILDVGANIGNHTVWFEKIAKARAVVPIEPQPRMLKHLKLNCALNRLTHVDFSFLGIALGSGTSQGTIEIAERFNPAGASIALRADGEVPVRRADDLFVRARFDFIKIDVEGAELAVIEGMQDLIRRCRPTMFVEVANDNIEQFKSTVDRLGYRVVAEYRRYDESTNLLVKPSTGRLRAFGDRLRT